MPSLVTIPPRGLGDILDDLNAVASAVSSYKNTGSIGPWFMQEIQAFNQLPTSVAILRQQIASVQGVFTGAGVAGAPSDDVTQAAGLVQGIESNYPAAQADLTNLTIKLLPIMPKLSAGAMDGAVVQALTLNGTQLVEVAHTIAGMVGDRDRARVLLQNAAVNPAVAPAVQNAALAAIQNASQAPWLKWVIGGGIAFVVMRGIMKR